MSDSRPSDIFKPGDLLNNTYRIEAILGRGGTSEVYRARNEISKRLVAIKALKSEFSRNEDYLTLMTREEEIRDIRHDAVVRYSENHRTREGLIYLVMDYVEGPPLEHFMLNGGMGAADLLKVLRRVAQGLQAAHRRNIVHRDLSPDNIILRGGQPRRGGDHRLRHRQGHQSRCQDHRRQRIRRQIRLCGARAAFRPFRSAHRYLFARQHHPCHLPRQEARPRPQPDGNPQEQGPAAGYRGAARAAEIADRQDVRSAARAAVPVLGRAFGGAGAGAAGPHGDHAEAGREAPRLPAAQAREGDPGPAQGRHHRAQAADARAQAGQARRRRRADRHAAGAGAARRRRRGGLFHRRARPAARPRSGTRCRSPIPMR